MEIACHSSNNQSNLYSTGDTTAGNEQKKYIQQLSCKLYNFASFASTVKTLYNVTHYNRIFNIRHKIAGNGSVSIKIPSLQHNIYLTTLTVTSWNRYKLSFENKFIITELLPCVRHFCDQNKVFLHEQVSVSLDKREALCILMQYEMELTYTFGIIAF